VVSRDAGRAAALQRGGGTLALVDGHRSAERRSLAMHHAIADRLRADPSLVSVARKRLVQWRATGRAHLEYVDAWERALALPLEDLCAQLVDLGEQALALRQVSPFAGVLSAPERWRIIKSVA